MTDFPRGWTLNSFVGPGSTASIVVPAIPGVVHVLDSFNAVLEAAAAAAAGLGADVNLTSSDGTFTAFVLGVMANAGGAVGSDTASGSGLDLAAGPGASLTISFNIAAAANYNEFLLVQGHDI